MSGPTEICWKNAPICETEEAIGRQPDWPQEESKRGHFSVVEPTRHWHPAGDPALVKNQSHGINHSLVLAPTHVQKRVGTGCAQYVAQ